MPEGTEHQNCQLKKGWGSLKKGWGNAMQCNAMRSKKGVWSCNTVLLRQCNNFCKMIVCNVHKVIQETVIMCYGISCNAGQDKSGCGSAISCHWCKALQCVHAINERLFNDRQYLASSARHYNAFMQLMEGCSMTGNILQLVRGSSMRGRASQARAVHSCKDS